MNWILKPVPPSAKVHLLSEQLGIDSMLTSLLVQRGINTFDQAKTFFRPSLDDLFDPFLMKDMDRAVERILTAFSNQENILVYGDYDVDGTTAVSLVYSFIKEFYPSVGTYIPDRYKEGYGISYQGIDFASDNDVSLIIALDCGIKALEQVDYARKKGIDFIICDHHRPGKKLPNAVAVLDPKRFDCEYPYKELCGCGVGFKLIQAISSSYDHSEEQILSYLDLVATAIAADIVPITGENRILAYFGMTVINKNPRPGIQAILSNLNKPELSITDVVFTLAPRINAAGRMEHGQFAVNLLTEKDPQKARDLANSIDHFNAERKEMDRSITTQALEQIIENDEVNNVSTVVYKEDWHKGVIGIVASRLIEKYYRPTLVFTNSGSKIAGSARSVKGFDVYNALEACQSLIEQFGGHKYAAGLTLLPENYEAFKKEFERVVKNSITDDLMIPQIAVDTEVNLSELDAKFYRILKQFGPFGPQNMKPVFMASGLRDNGYGKRVGQNGEHLKLSIISGGDRKTYNAIGFGMGEKFDLIRSGVSFKAVFTLETNTWNGQTNLQLNLRDLKLEE